MKNQILCREDFGRLVCRFNAEKVLFNAMEILNVDIYTSDYCPWCPEAIDRINSFVSPLGKMVNVNIIKDENKAKDNSINVYPTVKIGDTRIEGVPEQDMVWNAIINEIPTL